jgi:hypothetical protein
MAFSMTTDFSLPVATPAASVAQVRVNNRRRITPQAGHALEKLGHAIEYLTDEFVHRNGEISSSNGELQAVQLLMAKNRQVYFECPIVLTLGERLRAAFHLPA